MHKILLILLLTVNFFSVFESIPVAAMEASKGKMDTTEWDYSKLGPIPLRGEWEFYSFELLEPNDFHNGAIPSKPTYINLPIDLSNVVVDGKQLPSDLYGTLRMTVQIGDLERVYGLKSNYISTSHKVWVNGNLVTSMGQVATTKNMYTAQYGPMESIFIGNDEEIEIVIQFSNFQHRRVRINSIYFGPVSEIHKATTNGIIKDSILFGSLCLIGLYHLILFILQRKEKLFIYFALISFVTGLRTAVVNERLINRTFPDLPAEIITKIGFLPVFILLPLFILYIKEIFQSSVFKKPAKVSTYAIIILTLIVFITPVKFYDALFEYGQWLFFIYGLYILYLLTTKEFIKKKSGSFVMLLGGLVVLITGVLDTLRELDMIQTPELLSTGVLVFILSQAFYLAWRNNDSFNKAVNLARENERMYDEINELNNVLEKKVELRTKELSLANRKLEQISKIDPLTDLPNRRSFDEKLLIEWERALSNQEPLCVMMVDIDFFKGYNDYYGHLQGDECLRQVARYLQQKLDNDSYFVARYGGEEFVILLTNTDYPSANNIAESLRQSIENLKILHHASEASQFVTISVGVYSAIPQENENVDHMINRADQALYKAKQTNRNIVCLYEE